MNHQYDRTGPTSRLRHWALAALLATGAVGSAQAQFYAATGVSNTAGTYTDLGTTGTAIATANTDDDNSAAQNIGFPFTYNGTAYTQFVLNTNGYIKLGATAPVAPYFNDGGLSTTGGPTSGTDTDLIMPFNGDLTAGTAGGTEYRVSTTGTAPNRVCTIQWKNISDKARATTPTSAAIDVQYANFSFQTKLYETSGQIEFVYGTATPGPAAGVNPKIMNVGVKGATAASMVLGVKPSADAWTRTVFASGAYTGNGHNVRSSVLPDPGRTYRFSIQVPNDAYVASIQAYGSVAVPVGNPITIRGVVGNAGTTALTAKVVTLNITGANTYTATQTVASLPVNNNLTPVTFSGISLPNVGANTITISVASDGNNDNNSKTQDMATSATDFSFIAPGVPQTSSYGFQPGATASTSAFCAKFTVNAARSVTAVRAGIGADPNLATNNATVFGVVIDATTGALLGRSADYVITTADLGQVHTFTLTAPVTVPTGSFLVGLAQVLVPGGTQVYPMGYQAEVPARTGLFFSTSVSGTTTPTDGAVNNARYMLEAVTAAPSNNDVAVNEVQGYGTVAVPVGNPFSLRAVVRNAGAAVQTNVVVTLNITGANTYTATQTVTSLAVGATTTVTFSGISLPNVGVNTMAASVVNDDNNTNNTASRTLNTSATRFSHQTPGAASGNNVLSAGVNNYYAAKITLNATRDITSVTALISDAGNQAGQAKTSVGETVYGVVINATTGALLGRSPNYVITAADVDAYHTFTFSAPVNVPAGDVLIGMAQTTPSSGTLPYFPFGVQNETPNRPDTYYTGSAVTTAAPTAALTSATTNGFKLPFGAETSAPATCLVPTAFTVTGSTSTSVSFSFTGRTGAIGYQIVYGPQGFTPGGANSTSTTTFTGTTYTLTGLTGGTAYEFYIRTICSATDQSAPAGPVGTTTACTPPVISTFPYTQNFDVIANGQTLPCGISVLDSNNDGFTWRATGTVDPNLATGSVARSGLNAMVYSYNTADVTVGANDWFFSPALTLTNTQTYRVSFFYRAAAGLAEALEVKYGTAATVAGQTNTIYTNSAITNQLYRPANNTTTPVVADITVPAGTYFVGFHAMTPGDRGFLAIDDLTIAAGPLATSAALKRAVSVFPNPSNTGVFNLEIHGANAKQALVVEVTNMLGQRVYTGTAKDNFQNSVNLSSLQSGIYSITVRNGQEYTQQQISIVK